MSDKVSAVIVAAGRSQRMGFDKLLTPLAGRPLLFRTIERLLSTKIAAETVVVVRLEMLEEIATLLAPLQQYGPVRLVPGGAQRQDSVQAGLAVLEDCDYVLIHDAARPFITRELVQTVLAAAVESGAAACGLPCSDSLKQASARGVVAGTVDRSQLWNVQTPQIFRIDLLRQAYLHASTLGTHFTDDTAVVEQFGHPVQLVPYSEVNLKVTTPADWKIAQALLLADGESSPSHELRRHLHDLNNHLTPLMGYSYLIANEFPEDSRGRKFANNIKIASERCQQTTASLQQLVREIFPRQEELPKD